MMAKAGKQHASSANKSQFVQDQASRDVLSISCCICNEQAPGSKYAYMAMGLWTVIPTHGLSAKWHRLGHARIMSTQAQSAERPAAEFCSGLFHPSGQTSQKSQLSSISLGDTMVPNIE